MKLSLLLFIFSLEQWTNEITLIGIIVTLLGIVFGILPWINNRIHVRKQLKKIKDISPEEIMGDRGLIGYGYREDSWCIRSVEDELKKAIQDPNSYVTVITGHFASGKSRLVYHYLKSEDCPFSKVYAPESKSIEEITKQVHYINPQDTIIVLDDIDLLYSTSTSDELGLQTLMSTIHNKGIKTIVTVTEGTHHFDQFKENCNKDIYRGRKPQAQIKFIQIKDIEKGDDCYLWCVANLKNEGFSTVIGGYVPELSREIPQSINSLKNDDKKTLVTYYVSTKYRRHEGKEKRILLMLHQALWSENHYFDESLGRLVKLGYLKKQVKGRRGTKEYREYYELANRRQYDAFITRSASNQLRGNENLNLQLFTANTKEAEQLQIDKYLQLESGDPLTYSRLISHCLFDENINYVESKLWDYLKSQGKDRPVPEEYHAPIGDLIRRKSDGFESAKKWIKEGRITLTEDIVSNLLIRSQEREQIYDFLNEQGNPITDENARTIFYHICKESLTTEHEPKRINKAYSLYTDQIEDRYIKQNYCKYCECILRKANSIKRIDAFWALLKNECDVEMLLNRNALKRYLKELSENNRDGRKDPIIIQAYSGICDHWQSLTFVKNGEEDEIKKEAIATSMTKTAIEGCKKLDSVLRIFKIFSDCEHISNERTKNMVSYDIYDHIDPKNDDDINKARVLLIDRMSNTPEMDATFKMINKYLENMSSLKMIFEESDRIKNELGWEGSKELINRDTINVMLKVVRKSIKEAIDTNSIVKDIVQINHIQKSHEQSDEFVPLPIFRTEIYSCAAELIKKGADKDQISRVLSFAEGNITNRDTTSENERLVFDISERARPASITDIDMANELVRTCIAYINKYQYLHPDIVSNILLMYSISFRQCEDASQQLELKNNIDQLIREFDNQVMEPNITYCAQVLRYLLMTKERMSANEIISYIRNRYKQLLNLGEDLNNEKNDLFRIAVHHSRTSVDNAFALLTDAATYSKGIKRARDYHFNARLITAFVQKMTNDASLSIEEKRRYLQEVQTIINNHPYLDYSDEAWRMIITLKKSRLGLNFPITSLDRDTRHNMWDYYVTEQKSYMLDDNTIREFINRERDDIKMNKNPNGQHYIDEAYQELDARKRV